MTLQDNNLAMQETARQAFNDYIQYLYIFGELENGGNDNNGDCEAASENLSTKSSGF